MDHLSKAYTSVALTNYSLAFFNDAADFIASKILPIFPVQKQAGKVFRYGKDALRIVDTKRAIGGSYNKVNLSVEQTSLFFLEDYGLFGEILDEDITNAELAIDPEMDETEALTSRLMLDMEKKCADTITDPAIITHNVALTGGDKWNQPSTSDPFDDIIVGRNAVNLATGKEANTLIMGRDVLWTLTNHLLVRNRFPGSPKITPQMVIESIGALFGFEQVLIGKVKYNNSNLGAASQPLAGVRGDVCIVAYIETSPRKKSTTLGWTFTRTASWRVQRAGKAQIGKEAITNSIYSLVVVNMPYDQVLVDTDCAYLIYDIL